MGAINMEVVLIICQQHREKHDSCLNCLLAFSIPEFTHTKKALSGALKSVYISRSTRQLHSRGVGQKCQDIHVSKFKIKMVVSELAVWKYR